NLRTWVTQQQNIDLIRFRPVVPWNLRNESDTSFNLTPQETSRLLIDAFEAFVSTQDDKGIEMLISVIQNGNPKNKYALIGLLMRAIQ
ncbi:MAG: HEAT repeat domain-containing protein, partial [Parachlamydiaceae bacterium]|nr:HEAT repeat domain-containing protein [Parachlamydiaceae bacterium]